MEKKKILMVCEAFGGGVFTYVSQLCNDMVDDFEVYLAYSLRPQTPKNYKPYPIDHLTTTILLLLLSSSRHIRTFSISF